MASLFFILLVIALLDSTSMIPISLVPLATILGGKRPVFGTLSFLSGIFLVYASAGLLLLLGFDAIFDALRPSILRWWNNPNTPELLLQLVIGTVMLVFAWKQYKLPRTDIETETPSSIRPARAFALGASLTVIGIPGAVPYFGAIEQILRSDPGQTTAIISLLFYNIVFLAPFFALLLVRLLIPKRSEQIFGAVTLIVKRSGKHLIVGALLFLGIILIADAVGWFLGSPLLPTSLEKVNSTGQC